LGKLLAAPLGEQATADSADALRSTGAEEYTRATLDHQKLRSRACAAARNGMAPADGKLALQPETANI
jgi:hypothetical protein